MKKVIAVFIMVCMLISVMSAFPVGVLATSEKWYDNFTQSSEGVTIDEENETVTLTSLEGGEDAVKAELWYSTDISEDFFDVEWDMTFLQMAGNENVQIRTGTKRVFFALSVSGVSVIGGSSFSYNAPLGENHHYRAVWENNMGRFYFDGKFMGNFTLTESVMRKGFGFWVQGIKGDSQMMITNAKMNEKGSSSTVTETNNYNYYEEFYDSGAEAGEMWMNTNPELIKWKDGLLQLSNINQGNAFIHHWFHTTPEYDFTMRCRFNSIGDSGSLSVIYPGKMVKVNFMHQGLRVNGVDTDPVELTDGNWHILRIKSYNHGDSAAVYLDDKLYYAGATTDDTSSMEMAKWKLDFTSNFTTTKDPWDMQVDWIKCTGAASAKTAELVDLTEGAVYTQGDAITLKASVEDSDGTENVDFLANGNVIATASAPDFEAVVSDLQPGNYKIYPMLGSNAGASVDITVQSGVEGVLSVTPNGSGLDMQVAMTDPLQSVAKVEYLVDGVVTATSSSAGSNYAVNIPSITPAAHTITAFFRNGIGRKIGEASVDYICDVDNENGSVHYMNELSYTVAGTSGNAVVTFSNGSHKVQLTHSADGVRYLTDSGEETFALGTGDFRILTDGATADVYRNGQLAFSYYLPMTEEVGRSVVQNGMTVTGVTTSIPKGKMNYFVKENLTASQEVYHFAEIPYYHNTDFIADQNDAFRLVLADGHYRTDVEFENGKIYVRKTLKDKTEPYREEVAAALSGKAYYRAEVAAGMVRLYGNGRWLTTFRAEHAEGDQFLAVRVAEGSTLDYLNVHDNTDLYFYEDDFSGNGETASLDFWMTKNTTAPTLDDNKGLVLDALGKTEAITELGAYAGTFDFSADVTVEEGNGGFYLILNHAVTNGYSKIGYSFENGQYELVERNEDTYTSRKTAEGQFPVGEKVSIRLKVVDNPTGKTAVLFVNGQEVLSCGTEEILSCRGRVGFVLDDAKVSVSHVSYRGDAKVNIGMTEAINSGTTTDTLEIDDKIILTGSSKRRYTTDGGKTWATESKPANESNNVIQLRDKDGNLTGSIISVYRKKVSTNDLGLDEYAFFVARSDDNGKTYTEISRMQPDGNSNRIVMNNRVTQGPSGRLYFASCENQSESYGAARIYYSDDGGYNWTASETDLRYQDTGFVVAETVALEMGNGVVRCYVRNDLGFIIYFNSYDKGKTWDLTPNPTPFLSATNCYNIEVDPYNPNHMYIAWGYDNSNLHATVQVPRTRFGVAMSRDCGETWEYVGTAHENTSVINSMMNLNINVTKDYLVIGQCFSTDQMAVSVSNDSLSRDILIPKDKIKTTKDFEQVHMRWAWMDNTVTMGSEITHSLLLASPSSGTVLLHGELMTDAAYDNMIALDCAASYVGAKAEMEEDGSAVLSVGDKFVNLSADILAEKDGKMYVKMEEFAELLDLTCTDYQGVKMFDQFGVWNATNSYIARAMVDLFYYDTEEEPEDPIGSTLEEMTDGYKLVGTKDFSTLPTNSTAVRAPENGMQIVADPDDAENSFLRLTGSDVPIKYTNSSGEEKTASGGGEYAMKRPEVSVPENGIMRARMRLVSGTGFKFEFRGAGSGYRIEFRVDERATKFNAGTELELAETMAKGTEEWFEVLAFNTADKIQYYWMNTDGTYSPLTIDESILTDSSQQMVIIPDLSSVVDIDFVEGYEKIQKKTEDQLLTRRTELETVDFTNADSSTYGTLQDGRYVHSALNYKFGDGHAYGSKVTTGSGLLTMKVPARLIGTEDDVTAGVPYTDGCIYPFARFVMGGTTEMKTLSGTFGEGRILNFRFKYYNVGRNRNGGGGSEIQLANGQKEVCMTFGATGLTTRGMSAEGDFASATHEAGRIYEYMVAWITNDTEDIADDYLEVWRKVDEEEVYTYIGKWYDMERNSSEVRTLLCGNSDSYISYDFFRVYSEDSYTTHSISATYTLENETLTAKATLTAPDTASYIGKLIAATYDDNGRLIDMELHDAAATIDVTLDAADATSFKLMWWDDMNHMEPISYCYSKKLEVEDLAS